MKKEGGEKQNEVGKEKKTKQYINKINQGVVFGSFYLCIVLFFSLPTSFCFSPPSFFVFFSYFTMRHNVYVMNQTEFLLVHNQNENC